nr:MAG TPA: hypothetical protein [Caudoviricetes sp.]
MIFTRCLGFYKHRGIDKVYNEEETLLTILWRFYYEKGYYHCNISDYGIGLCGLFCGNKRRRIAHE